MLQIPDTLATLHFLQVHTATTLKLLIPKALSVASNRLPLTLLTYVKWSPALRQALAMAMVPLHRPKLSALPVV